MRRKDREVADPRQIQKILEDSRVLRLGLTDGTFPYVVPLHYGFVFQDGKLVFYAHSAREGRKLDLIRANPNVCVELDSGATLISGGDAPCRYGASYASIIAFGTAKLVEDAEEKRRGLQLLMKNQTGRDFDFRDPELESVAALRIDATSYSTKSRPGPVD